MVLFRFKKLQKNKLKALKEAVDSCNFAIMEGLFDNLPESQSLDSIMTMPNERTRALRWAGEFLKEISQSADCPEAFRLEARKILRHYPSPADIAHQAKFLPFSSFSRWLAPENVKENHLNGAKEPVPSSHATGDAR